MNKPIHVMQLIDGMEVGGAEIMLRDSTRGLLARGYKISIGYCTPGSLIKEFEEMGVPLVHTPWSLRVDPFLLFRMIREIRHVKPQIVHTHLFKSDFHGRWAARLSGVPTVISTLHSCNDWARNPIFGRIYGLNARSADKVIAVSDEVHDYSLKYLRTSPDRTITIANGIPLDRFENKIAEGRAIRSEFGIGPDIPLIGIVARLTPEKDHKNFLDAAKHIISAVPNARFLIVGDGPLRESLIKIASALNLDDAVIFCGLRKDIPAILASLDLLVFSSIVEGMPVALLEGMAASKPVVATAVGGIPSVVVKGETGSLVPAQDPIALANACIELINNPQLCQSMSRAAFKRVKSKYSIESMIDQVSEIYQALFAQQGVKEHG